MFWQRKDSMKTKCYVFSGYRQRNKECLMYLEGKLQQDRYGWCIFKLTWQETVERTYLETIKIGRRYHWCCYMLKCIRNCNNCIFGLWQETSKRECMYLGFKNPKISSKRGEQWSERKKQRTNDVFWGWKSTKRCRQCNYNLNCKKEKI